MEDPTLWHSNFSRWPVGGGKRVAVILEVNFEGWTEEAAPGQPMPPLRKGTVDLYERSYGEYAVNAGLRRLLSLMARCEVTATILTSGILAERCPELLGTASSAGHEIAGHGYAQNLLSCYLTKDEEIEQMEATFAAIERATGAPPSGWRSPRSTPGAHTNALLAARGVLWHGNSDRADLPIVEDYSGRKIAAIQRPTWINDLVICAGHGRPARDLVIAFEDVLEYCVRAPEDSAQVISVAVHAHHFGRPHGAWALEKIIEKARATEEVWIARNVDVARVALDACAQTESATP